ncbi:DUF362 domain-containing protein [Heliorestis acidaminivorans]|uniref:DUF362 domain-containing protein n=1 Tax=Heliorestis acidaminivorans TaxID=553427 RepID=A0A6I0EXF9_9FIRM|nr:DUF362 domain-containing protein [Heliorestis acidaminivorans]KAB2952970.1 DUF362 domain-containing protein [Heliorestis acidaminivorans]
MSQKKERLAVTACARYDQDEIDQAVQRLLDRLGDTEAIKAIQPGMRIALKPNLVMAKEPERAITTHPAVLSAVARLLLDKGAKPFIIDSPGGPASARGLETLYTRTGMKEVAQQLGLELCYDMSEVEVPLAGKSPIKKIYLLKAIVEADGLINLPKIKTHGQTGYTGAVKNLYGAIPGLRKAEYHFRLQERAIFSQLLLDLNELLKPLLHIADGVIGMEGDGPTGGVPKPFGYLFASSSPYALDHYVLSLIKLSDIETDLQAQERALLGHFEVLDGGEEVQEVPFRPAKSRQVNFAENFLPRPLADFVSRRLRPLPSFHGDKCTGCRICLKSCPSQALTFQKLPQLERAKCFGCLCCHELCPEGAISIRRSFLDRPRSTRS